jgi:hypothetical protein
MVRVVEKNILKKPLSIKKFFLHHAMKEKLARQLHQSRIDEKVV